MQKQISLFTFLICALSLTNGQDEFEELGVSLPADECLGGQPAPLNVTAEGCSRLPCDVFLGRDFILFMYFEVPEAGDNLEATVQVSAFGKSEPFTLPDKDRIVCPNLQLGSCPLSAGELGYHRFVFPVGTKYPPIPVTLELTVTADNGVIMYCTRVPIHIRAL